MSVKGQTKTSLHLLLACIVTTFGVMLMLLIMAMAWELWMVPVILIGNTLVWCIHIARAGSDNFYENLCAGLLMVGFFFFGVHEAVLFDMTAVACMLLLIFSMFNKKRLLYMTVALYVLVLLYHFLILHTIYRDMGAQDIIRLMFGATVVAGAMAIAKYRIDRRRQSRKKYSGTLAELEKAGKQNAEFLSNVSHELRTPINMVLGISEVILEKGLPEEARTDIQSIQIAGKRLSNQINNMLDYTEIVEGTLVPAKEPYMMVSVLNDIITMTAMQGGKNQLEMVFDLDPKMPALLNGDAEKISHVLKILLENSIKFTEEGGINVHIGFRRESYGINLLIDICDTGIGMSDSQITQMCDDFYQADTGSSRFAGGLGLGLPIARGLLHAMGGFIHFDSKEQQGLQVHITIPQGVEDDTPSIVISNPEKLCIACYFRPEKYSCDEVRRFYDNMVLHMVEGLGLEGYQAHNFDGLLKLQNSHPLTHVFIAQAEYEENRSYYEELAYTLRVVIIAERGFTPGRDSRLMVIHKPFFALSIVNLLNGEMKENGFGEAQAAGRKPFSCEGIRVLAVDDEEMNLMVAKGVLGSYGMHVDTCLSGREAVERCASTPYDIVFLDHMMPGFDGVQTLKQIRSINNGIYQELPVIALTANTISGAREMFRNEGFTEFIPKPIERAVLERILRKVLPRDSIQYVEGPGNAEQQENMTPLPVVSGGKKKKKRSELPERKAARPEEARRKNVQTKDAGPADAMPDKSDAQKNLSGVAGLEETLPGKTRRRRKRPKGSVWEEPYSEKNRQEKRRPEKAGRKEIPSGENSWEEALPKEADWKEILSEEGSWRETLSRETTKERTSEKSGREESGWEEVLPENSDWEEMQSEESGWEEALPEDLDWEETPPEEDGQEEVLPEDPDWEETPPEESDWEEAPSEEPDWEDMQPEEDEEERTLPEEETWDEDSLEEYDPDEDFLEDDSDQINHSSADFAPLSKIGINVQLGMDYCCGEEAFYLEMLQMFCSQAPEKKAEIIALYENRNWKDYTVKVHALKSTSMTIGAERLAEQALLLEQAGKKGRTDYIRHNHPMLLRLYDEICETISGL